jgi:nicotinate-nucleotide pyrophosphorylase
MDPHLFYRFVEQAFEEDLGDGDHSTLSCISATARGKAVLKIKQSAVITGMDVAERIFLYKDPSAIFTAFVRDGDTVQPGEIAFEVESFAAVILQCERLVLNCMQRMRDQRPVYLIRVRPLPIFGCWKKKRFESAAPSIIALGCMI